MRVYLDWLAIVARDEIAVLWPLVEKVAHALVARRTLTTAEVKVLLALPTSLASSADWRR